MIPMALHEVAAVVDGEVADEPSYPVTISGDPFADSRRVVAGGLFVAVAGERVDGHEYAADAVAGGAAAVLAARPVGVPSIVVDDPVLALGHLAHHVLGRLPALRVVGITGSSGKTSTKDIVAQLLERAGETVAPTGSYNTELGVPLTALRVRETTAYLVAEMGARAGGHIAYLASMVRPTVGVVLNVGAAHLGEFGDQDGIAAAKGELVEALPASGLAVLNADDVRVAAMRDRTSATVVTFGTATDADLRVTSLRTDDLGQPLFTLHARADSAEVVLPLAGEHQALNAAAAAAVALGLGMHFADVVETLRTVRARSPWRMEIAPAAGGVTVINDAYNANPDSMRAALRALADLGRRRSERGRTFAVLGEMKELGPAGPGEHDAIGRLAVRLDVSRLVVVGEEARPIHHGARSEAASDEKSVCVPDVDAAVGFLRAALRPGDLVLVKASRAAGLERVAAALMDTGAGADSSADDAVAGRDRR